MNIKMVIAYEGTRYNGWQKQKSTENTIQGKLERLVSEMTGEKIEIQGAGRTDRGVHARGQVFHFHTHTEMTPQEMLHYANQYLPEDIGVMECKEVSERFHSRLNATGKVYQYRIWNSEMPNIFERKWVYGYPDKLDVEKMKEAAEYLLGTHDFKAFSTNKKTKKTTVRTLEEIKIEQIGAEIRMTYIGNGFLYHMARILTGTLIEVGNHEKEPEQIKDILESKDRAQAGFLVPGHGLTLLKVRY